MEVVANNYLPGDQRLVDKIVYELKAQGIFDYFRKECFADVDTKPAYQNLRQRVEGSVSGFLKEQSWRPDMNKNQVREMLRKTITESGYLETGVERIVDQVVNPKINTVFLPKVEEVVYSYLGIKKPNRNEATKTEQIDLLPTDLEAVSPESEPVDKKDDKSTDILQDLDESNKTEEDESPPFEPLEETSTYVPHEENSVDSHLSGFSGLISHESNQSNENKVTPMEQDSQMSRNSSDSRLSIVTSDENSKMDVCEDSQSKSIKSTDSNHKSEGNDKNKPKSSDRHKSRSDNKSDSKDRKSSKDSRSRHSSSSKDKDKSRDRKDSKSTSSSKDKPGEKSDKDKSREKSDKDRSKSSSSSSSKHATNSTSTSSKDKNMKKDSRSDKDKARSSASHKDTKPRDKSSDSKSKDKEKSSSDKHKHSSSSSHSDRHKKDKDKKKERSKDDHYSSKDKKNDRRSTDRDSNDGQSSKNVSSASSESQSQTHKSTQESSSGGGDSGNSDHSDSTTKAPIIITGAVENSEVIISPPETQRVKVLKPKCASNIKEAMRLMKIRKQLAKLEKQNQLSLASVDVSSPIVLSSSINLDDWNKNCIRQDKPKEEIVEDVPPPLQNTVISQDNWDAMEAKLREEVSSEFKDYNDDSLEDQTKTDEKDVEDCKYFENVELEKIEFLLFVEQLIKSMEKYKDMRRGKTNKRKIEENNNKQMKIVPEKRARAAKRTKINNHAVSSNEKFPLPLSPAESEKSFSRKDETPVVPLKVKRNSVNKTSSQRYSSDDLYKPRPTFTSSRRRGAKNLEN